MSEEGAVPSQDGLRLATLPELVGPDGVFADGDWIESKDQDPEGNVRLVQLADIGDGIYRDRSNRFLTMQKAQELNCTFLERGDILIARMPDPLGRACIFPGDAKPSVTAVDVCIVRSRSQDVNPRWLLGAINSPQFRSQVAALQSGTTRKRISRKNLGSIKIPVPPKDEQDLTSAIVEQQFTRLDAAVAALQRVRANLKRYRAAIFQLACTGQLLRQDPNDGPAWLTLKEFVENGTPADVAGLPAIPDTWVWVRLDSIASVKGGVAKDAKKQSGPDLEEVPYLRVANVQRGYLDLREISTIRVKREVADLLELRSGDLLFTEGGDRDKLGRGSVWEGQVRRCIHQNHVFRARLKSDLVDPRFISWFANTVAQQWFERRGKQTTNLASISLSVLRSLPVPLVPQAEQSRIVLEIERRLSVLDEMTKLVEENLGRAEGLKQSVVADCFSGRLAEDRMSHAIEADDKKAAR